MPDQPEQEDHSWTPEFERNAKRFVSAVNEDIAAKYADHLLVSAEDIFKENLENLAPLLTTLREGGADALADLVEEGDAEFEKASALQTFVVVRISGHQRHLVFQAMGEIDALAAQHEGREGSGGVGVVYNPDFEADPYSYSSTLEYIFGDPENGDSSS